MISLRVALTLNYQHNCNNMKDVKRDRLTMGNTQVYR